MSARVGKAGAAFHMAEQLANRVLVRLNCLNGECSIRVYFDFDGSDTTIVPSPQAHIRSIEKEYKDRDRFERYHKQLPPKDAVAAVLREERMDDAFTNELLVKQLGRAGENLR